MAKNQEKSKIPASKTKKLSYLERIRAKELEQIKVVDLPVFPKS